MFHFRWNIRFFRNSTRAWPTDRQCDTPVYRHTITHLKKNWIENLHQILQQLNDYICKNLYSIFFHANLSTSKGEKKNEGNSYYFHLGLILWIESKWITSLNYKQEKKRNRNLISWSNKKKIWRIESYLNKVMWLRGEKWKAVEKKVSWSIQSLPDNKSQLELLGPLRLSDCLLYHVYVYIHLCVCSSTD